MAKQLNCILLIDDNKHDNFFHEKTIRKVGAAREVKSVYTGEQALEYLGHALAGKVGFPVPDLILLDINMPGMNGFDFIDRAMEEGLIDNSLVIIMLTSSLSPYDEEKAKGKYNIEINEMVNKPLTAKSLEAILNKYF